MHVDAILQVARAAAITPLLLSTSLQVLAIFPTTIRRNILRQLYLSSLKNCYLFQNTGTKFLDALMLGARVELFLPKVSQVAFSGKSCEYAKGNSGAISVTATYAEISALEGNISLEGFSHSATPWRSG